MALAATIVAAPMAFADAAHTSTGAIKTYNPKAHSITLADGTTYMLPAKFKASNVKVGEKVQVSWVMKGDKHDATQIKILK
jgi:hypothetical protein